MNEIPRVTFWQHLGTREALLAARAALREAEKVGGRTDCLRTAVRALEGALAAQREDAEAFIDGWFKRPPPRIDTL